MLRADVQALADMGLNQMSVKLTHPPVGGMVCDSGVIIFFIYFLTDP